MNANTINLLHGLFGMVLGALIVFYVQRILKSSKRKARRSTVHRKKTLIIGRLLFRLRRAFLVVGITSIMSIFFHQDLFEFIGLLVFLSVLVTYTDIILPRRIRAQIKAEKKARETAE